MKESRYVVVIVGGAVAGSEAVFQLRKAGCIVICIEQNPMPYGKIVDGLPRWHVEQRIKEKKKIDEKLNHPDVHFIPNTKIGEDLSFHEIYEDWKVSVVLLASGAWKDRPLEIKGIEQYQGKGLVSQNPLVQWFNHYVEKGYTGPQLELPDDIIVVGGGLASLDVLKICQIELTQKALEKRGIQIDMLSLEKKGIPKTLKDHQLQWEDLGLKGTTLFYRRTIKDMPLASFPENPTEEQMNKVQNLREKILRNFQTKYLFQVQASHLPVKLIVKNGRLQGLCFVKTEIVDSKITPISGTEKKVTANLIVSSIGSIPSLIPSVPSKGVYYDIKDRKTGEINGLHNVFALGNAVMGKGNIQVSLHHARAVSEHVLKVLDSHSELKLNEAERRRILQRVRQRQESVGYSGTYQNWMGIQSSG